VLFVCLGCLLGFISSVVCGLCMFVLLLLVSSWMWFDLYLLLVYLVDVTCGWH